jgi:hypothetical protein
MKSVIKAIMFLIPHFKTECNGLVEMEEGIYVAMPQSEIEPFIKYLKGYVDVDTFNWMWFNKIISMNNMVFFNSETAA